MPRQRQRDLRRFASCVRDAVAAAMRLATARGAQGGPGGRTPATCKRPGAPAGRFSRKSWLCCHPKHRRSRISLQVARLLPPRGPTGLKSLASRGSSANARGGRESQRNQPGARRVQPAIAWLARGASRQQRRCRRACRRRGHRCRRGRCRRHRRPRPGHPGPCRPRPGRRPGPCRPACGPRCCRGRRPW